jgi:transposase InsO family protein
MNIYISLLFAILRAAFRAQEDVVLENLALRHQLAILMRSARRPRLEPADRLLWCWLSRRWSGWRSAVVVVQPDTIVRWHRTAWRRYWTWRNRRPPGRPRISAEVRELIQRLARDNPRWGAVRIQGELRKLGIAVSARSVRRYRRTVKRRPPSQSWRAFLRNHAPQIWAADFLTVQTLTFHTLYVFFFVTHERRRVVHLNVTAHPTAEWVWRQLIAATPWREQPRYLVRDRDRCYGAAFIPRALKLGIETLLTPVQAPKANAIAERLVGTLRRECLDHLIVVNERHLLRLLREYVNHYNAGRPHRALQLEPPAGTVHLALVSGGRVIARPVLGGLLYEYERQAA